MNSDEFIELKQILSALSVKMDKRFTSMDSRIDRLNNKMNERFNKVETRLDRVETRLTNVENRLTNVENRLTNVETRLDKVEFQLEQHNNRFKGEDTHLENEINQGVMDYLVNTYKGTHFIFNENNALFPKHLRINVLDPVTKKHSLKEITEFDGLVIATNVPKYVEYLEKLDINNKVSIPPKIDKQKGDYIKFIIVESKTHLTKEKFNMKMRQKEEIEKFIRDVQAGVVKLSTKNQYQQIGLMNFETSIGIYLGGKFIDRPVEKAIDTLILDWQKKKPEESYEQFTSNKLVNQVPSFYGKVILKSNNYTVVDINNITNNMLFELEPYNQSGGRKPVICYKYNVKGCAGAYFMDRTRL